MNTSVLQKLTIENLRGSILPFSLSFEKGKKLTVVFGDNGTGKTTICDAFEFLGSGKIGSLEGRGLGQTERYWPSVGKKSADVSVILETSDSSCTAKIQKRNVVAVPADKRPKVEVLRRNQILRLLEAQPSARYAEIRRFIDVSGVETSEGTLKRLTDDLGGDRETAVAIVQENQNSIGQFWESAGKPGKDAFAWADAEVTQDLSEREATARALDSLRAAYHRLTDYPQKLETATAAIDSARSAVTEATRQLNSALANTAEGTSELVEILEAAQPFLEKHPHPESCPLCESTEKVANLRENVEQRLKRFADLQTARRNKTAADQGLQNAERNLSNLQNGFAGDRASFENERSARDWGATVVLPTEQVPLELRALSGWITSTSQLPDAWATSAANLTEQNQFVATLRQALATYRSNVAAQEKLDELLPKLKRALEIVMEERRKFTDGVLKTIADEVGRIYEVVHPGEGLDKISLELDPSRRASLEIGASFAGRDNTPPQAYFSQSHLDTLGLCVFLALAALESPTETILVLDDVLASVDEPHVERLIEMLYAEVLRFRHCVITTHYRPWKHKLRWGWLKHGQCQFIELTKWTLADGLTMIHSVPEVERLRAMLTESPPDLNAICSKAGVILEAILEYLTVHYECSVPRRASGLYTLGDLLPAIDKKLRQALRVEVLQGMDKSGAPIYKPFTLGPILDELTRISQLRNVVGCHFNAISFDLLDTDSLLFGQQVLALAETLTDQEAGWPKNGKSGEYWSTNGETRRLYPYRRPS